MRTNESARHEELSSSDMSTYRGKIAGRSRGKIAGRRQEGKISRRPVAAAAAAPAAVVAKVMKRQIR